MIVFQNIISPFKQKLAQEEAAPGPIVNLLDNGEFTNWPGGPPIFPPTDWTLVGSGTANQAAPGEVRITDGGGFDTFIWQDNKLTIGVTYRYEVLVTARNGNGYVGYDAGAYVFITATGLYTGTFVAQRDFIRIGPLGNNYVQFDYVRIGI